MIESVFFPQNRRLTSLAIVKSRLRITTDADDDLLTGLIEDASDVVRTVTRREFTQERVRQTNVREEDGFLILDRTPVVEVHSASQGGTPLLDELEIYDRDAGMVTRKVNALAGGERLWWNDSFRTGIADPFVVEYTGGFVPAGWTFNDGSPIPRTMPFDVEGAIIDIIRSTYADAQPGGDRGELKSIKVEDITYQYEGSSEGGVDRTLLSVADRLSRWIRTDV